VCDLETSRIGAPYIYIYIYIYDISSLRVKVSDSSAALSFSSSLCWLCHFLSSVKYEVLQSIALALFISVYHVFSEQYVPCSGQIYVTEITQGDWSISRLFCSVGNSGTFGLHYSCLTQLLQPWITSGFFIVSPIHFSFSVFTIFAVYRNGMSFISRLSRPTRTRNWPLHK